MTQATHIPVLLEAVLRLLQPRANGTYIDATLGAGGHAEALLQASGPQGRLLGLDQDTTALHIARTRLAVYGDRADLVHANFRDLSRVAQTQGWTAADGILSGQRVANRIGHRTMLCIPPAGAPMQWSELIGLLGP